MHLLHLLVILTTIGRIFNVRKSMSWYVCTWDWRLFLSHTRNMRLLHYHHLKLSIYQLQALYVKKFSFEWSYQICNKKKKNVSHFHDKKFSIWCKNQSYRDSTSFHYRARRRQGDQAGLRSNQWQTNRYIAKAISIEIFTHVRK